MIYSTYIHSFSKFPTVWKTIGNNKIDFMHAMIEVETIWGSGFWAYYDTCQLRKHNYSIELFPKETLLSRPARLHSDMFLLYSGSRSDSRQANIIFYIIYVQPVS